LRRTISGTIGQPAIRIHDEVCNRGNSPAPHMILYHCNFGWPLADEGADIVWNGSWKPRYADGHQKIFREGQPFRKIPAPLESHAGTGEEACVIDTLSDVSGHSQCGIYNSAIGLAVVLRYPKKQLPWLTNWQHWGKNEYVTGLEPGTNAPIGQARAREQKELIELAPGETRTYDLEIKVLSRREEIDAFMKNI
jgi:hypothetical protein